MRIHRLIPTVLALLILAAVTMTTVQYSVESGTTSAQQAISAEPAESDGLSSVQGAETKEDTELDLYLDADEVEKRAAAEQTGDASITPSRVPVSFKHVPIPLPGGIDHAVAGVGTRNSGQGVIRLRGVPPGSTLLTAFLIWGEIIPPPAAGYTVNFGPDCAVGANFNSAVYGTTTQPCWNGLGIYAGHIINVTGQIVAGINGDYRIKGLKSAITNNRCPWPDGPGCAGPGNALPLSEGASLVVVYSNPCIPRAAQLYINLGPRQFSGPHSATHFALPVAIRPNLPNLKHSRIGADGQVGVANCGLRAITSITDERTWIENPATGGSVQIKGDVAGLNRDSDWNGFDGEPLNKLWDSHTDVFLNSNFLAFGGGLSYRVRYLSQGDCIVWAVHILGVR